MYFAVRIQRGGTGSTPSLKNHKFIRFLSNTGPDPLKITKLPSQHSRVGHYQPTSETPFQWRFTGRPIITLFWWSFELAPLKKQHLSDSDKTFWIRPCFVTATSATTDLIDCFISAVKEEDPEDPSYVAPPELAVPKGVPAGRLEIIYIDLPFMLNRTFHFLF